MKLRITNNSVRLRVTPAEVKRFCEAGWIEDALELGTGPDQRFIFGLQEVDSGDVRADLEPGRITILVPKIRAERWTRTDQVGIECEQRLPDGGTVRIVIEKDLAYFDSLFREEGAEVFMALIPENAS